MLQIAAVVNCPHGHSTSKLFPGHFTSKQTVPFEAECPGPTVYFEVKCPEGGLLRSNLPPGHFTSGDKLLRDSPVQ